jgi:hypothetical protein
MFLGLLAAAGLLTLAVRGPRMGRLPLLLSLCAATLVLNLAVLLLPGGGLGSYARRLERTGHAEFFVRAARAPSILGALMGYEDLLGDGQPATFSRQKGPANLAFHVAVHRIAQRSPLRERLDAMADRVPGLADEAWRRLTTRSFGQPWRGPTRFTDLDRETVASVLRSFLLMPVVSVGIKSLIPLAALLLGAALFEHREAVLFAIGCAFLPAILFEFVLLDGSLFPLLFLLGAATFCLGIRTGRGRWGAGSGAITAFYGYFTLSAVTLIGFCGSLAGVELAAKGLREVRQREEGRSEDPGTEPRGPVDSARPVRLLAAYASAYAASVLALRFLLQFQIVERYTEARLIQASWRWRLAGSTLSWAALNSLEFGLTLGPIVAGFGLLGVAASTASLARGRDCARPACFSIAVAVVTAILALAGANSEVYRLWAFLGPMVMAAAILGAWTLGWTDSAPKRVALVGSLLVWVALLCPRFGFLPPS